jgi:putative flippase GtrA
LIDFSKIPLGIRQFFSFGCVGVAGLIVDAGVLWSMLHVVGLDPYSSRLISYIAAATVTWALNRSLTFRQQRTSDSLWRQWFKFLLANLSGFAANYLVYALCINTIPIMAQYQVLALIPASIVGLVFNFTASKKLVFR